MLQHESPSKKACICELAMKQTPRPVLRSPGSCRRLGTVPGSRGHRASCHCPLTAVLTSGEQGGFHRGGIVTRHLIWSYGTILPQNSFLVYPGMQGVRWSSPSIPITIIITVLVSLLAPPPTLCFPLCPSHTVSLQTYPLSMWASFSLGSFQCWGNYDTERSRHSP